MSLVVKIIISLALAALAGAATSTMGLSGPAIYAVFAIVSVAAVLIGAWGGSGSTAANAGSASNTSTPPRKSRNAGAPAGEREQGQVKWFNVSKGFGFITKDDGEEIFVHFRSIRGSGRRGLRDGQRVSFVVAQSDKGPQAEDVEGID